MIVVVVFVVVDDVVIVVVVVAAVVVVLDVFLLHRSGQGRDKNHGKCLRKLLFFCSGDPSGESNRRHCLGSANRKPR